MSKKTEKKSKEILNISSPSNFEHRLHVGADSVDIEQLQALFGSAFTTGSPQISPRKGDRKKESENGPVENGFSSEHTLQNRSPPPPCPNRDISDEQYRSESLIELLKVELIPALRFELDQLLDQKLTTWFKCFSDLLESSTVSPLLHCQTHCKCQTLNFSVHKRGQECGDVGSVFGNFPSLSSDGSTPETPNGGFPLLNGTSGSPADSPHFGKKRKHAMHNPVYPVEEQRHVIPPGTADNSKSKQDLRKKGHRKAPKPPDASLKPGRNEEQGKQPSGNTPTSSDKPLPGDRECLARALQLSVGAIVEGLDLEPGVLQDALVTDGCINREEKGELLKQRNSKDQTRATIVLVKGRDLPVLHIFLNHLKKINTPLLKEVLRTYDKVKFEGYYNKQCLLCKTMTNVNLKYVIDMLWLAGIVEEDLCNQVRSTDLPVGAQDVLWRQVVAAINDSITTDRLKVISVLRESLTRYNHYHNIATPLESFLQECDFLRCVCQSRDQKKFNQTKGFANPKPHGKPNPQEKSKVRNKVNKSNLAKSLEELNTNDKNNSHELRSSVPERTPLPDSNKILARRSVSLEDIVGHIDSEQNKHRQFPIMGVGNLCQYDNLSDKSSNQGQKPSHERTDSKSSSDGTPSSTSERPKKPVPIKRATKLNTSDLQASYV